MPRKIKIGARARARRDRVLTKKLKFSGRHQRNSRNYVRRVSNQRDDTAETNDSEEFRHDIAALVFCGKREYIVIRAMPLTKWVTTSHLVKVLGLIPNVFTRKVVNACLHNLYTNMLVDRKLSIESNVDYGYQYKLSKDMDLDKLPRFSMLCQRLRNMGI